MTDRRLEREHKDNNVMPEDPSWQRVNDHELDREIDAALAKYAAAEPRTGLEDRILASLQSARKVASARGRWEWRLALAFALAMVVIAATALMWKLEHPQPTAVLHPTSIETRHNDVQREARNNSGVGKVLRPGQRRTTPKTHANSKAVTPISDPRLEQFPSPQPLSEQEQILESYIATFPEQASLVAEARTEALRKDAAEEMNYGSATEKDSQQ